MTSINHVAIYVRQLEEMRLFYEQYFQGRAGKLYHNPATGFSSYFMAFDSGARLELMHRKEAQSVALPQYPLGLVHLAFSVGSVQAVDNLTERLRRDGHDIVGQPRTTGDGYYESCVRDPEGNIIEITI